MNEKKQVNYYRMRAYPSKKDRYDYFIENGIVAIGWPKICAYGKTKEQIYKELAHEYNLSGKALGLTTGYFLRLLQMKQDDIIVIPYQNKTITIAKVVSPYFFDKNLESKDMANTVGIEVLKVLPVSSISPQMKRSIDTITTLISLNKYSEEIMNLLNNTKNEFLVSKEERITYITENTDKKITLTISNNVNKGDLENFIKQIFE